MLVVSREALRALSEAAFGDINHYLRPGHLKQLRNILDDKEASDNDKFVAFDFLKNANIAAGGVLPMCQDTGTAIIMAKKGCNVITDGDDEAALSEGARDAYLRRNLRYSQVAPLSMYEEKNTANNMPAQCEIYAEGDDAYKFMFMAKGGGSANKSFLFQATPSVLTRDRMLVFLKEKVMTLGTAACPPYHLAIVIGGTSAEPCLKHVKLNSARFRDSRPSKRRLSRTGIVMVGRDSAHAKWRERLEKGEPLPDYFKNHPVYYAGPAKTPDGYASGAFGPTTAGRMDSFVDQFQAAGGSMVMVAKGNRAVAVREACKKHGGFYLGSIGGAAANLAEHCINKVEVVEYPELGMEAIWRIEVVHFPAFVIIDDKGNDSFKELNLGQ